MTLSGGGSLTTTAGINCTTLTAISNSSITGNLNVTGSLTTSSFHANKPWVGVKYTGTLVLAGSPGFCQTGELWELILLQYQHTQTGVIIWYLFNK